MHEGRRCSERLSNDAGSTINRSEMPSTAGPHRPLSPVPKCPIDTDTLRKGVLMTLEPDGRGEPGSFLAAILNMLGEPREGIWNLLIGIEAAIIAILSVYIVRGLNVPESGLVAMALASAAMIPRFNSILAINRRRIWSEEGSGRRVNARSIVAGLSVFLGMFLGFSVVGILTDNAAMETHFQFILKETQVDANFVLTPERFSLGASVFVHNVAVLSAFAVLAFLYRSLGTMIALGWNASVWAITLVLFIGASGQQDANTVVYGLLVIIAIIPHLVTEAAAYVAGALSAIFLSRGITVYGLSDPRLVRVLIAVVVLAVASVALLGMGALLEHYYAPAILRLI